MGTEKFLIDTNVIIDFLAGKFSKNDSKFINSIIVKTPIISVITKIEVLGFKTNQKDYQILSKFISECIVLNLNEEVTKTTIELRKQNSIKLPDAIIASTCLVYDLKLLTRNVSDFKNLENLVVVNSHSHS
ncbi:MAG: type II toxin-antitoxin system VapC family toxin [Flavobacteriia bacterium]|jgi:predicted nucleic acid-binding protein